MHLNRILHGPQRTCSTSGLTGVAVYLQTIHKPMLLIVAKKIYTEKMSYPFPYLTFIDIVGTFNLVRQEMARRRSSSHCYLSTVYLYKIGSQKCITEVLSSRDDVGTEIGYYE